MIGGTLSGQTALVTGAAVRLGRACARALAARGAGVIIHYRTSAEEALRLADEIVSGGGRAWTLQADLTKEEEAAALVPRAIQRAGGLSILVNSAAIFPSDTVENMTLDAMVACLRVNAWAPLLLSRSFAEHAGRGKIVNFLDTRVAGYDWRHVSYIVSKHVLELLTRMCALQFAPEIAVNAVAPGLILPPPGEDHSYLDALVGTVPLRKHGRAEDVAEAVAFLATSEFLTGQVIYVDGGRHLLEHQSGPDPD